MSRLRRRYPYYHKKKLKVLYEKEYSEEISTWKIERVIRRYKLYADKKKAEKIARKRTRVRYKPKKRITQLMKQGRPCFLFHLDTIVIYWNNLKRYILTAVDHVTNLGYARMYKKRVPGWQRASFTVFSTSSISPLKIHRQIVAVNLPGSLKRLPPN
jgi:hypothetical protein